MRISRLHHCLLSLVLVAVLVAVAAPALGADPSGGASRPAAGHVNLFGHVNLLNPTPIAAVQAAAAQADAQNAVPAGLRPATTDPTSAYLASRCVPEFGPGTTYSVCSLGAVRSRRTVVLLGDSHAWMWTPALDRAGAQLGFRLVPLTKPGCALWALYRDRPGWPCLTWYSGVLRTISRLHPVATIVSFLTSDFTVPEAGFAASTLQRVLRAVPHPILLADTPGDDWYPANQVPTPSQCLSSPGATLGSCALHETAQMRASLGRIQAMVNRDGYAAIPTLQWFCADRICPTVIDGTVTSQDGNHITAEYARLLAPRLTDRLRPILRSLQRQESGGAGA